MTRDKNKKVLIALDFDPSALKVANIGFTLAKSMGAEVILLHVIINMLTYTLTYLKMGPMKLNSIEDFKLASKVFLDKSKLHPEVTMNQIIVKQGQFAESLLHAAKEMAVDIIVMGSHSSIWLEEIVMGRITNEILQQTQIPILIIPKNKNEKLHTFISLQN